MSENENTPAPLSTVEINDKLSAIFEMKRRVVQEHLNVIRKNLEMAKLSTQNVDELEYILGLRGRPVTEPEETK